MIKSMTGFGRGQEERNHRMITVELKSVNHRYFEFYTHVPRGYSFLEEKLKSFVNSKVARGKVECFVTIETLDDSGTEVVINHALASAYIKAFAQLEQQYHVPNDSTTTTITHYPDVLIVHKSDVDEAAVWNDVRAVCEKAMTAFVAMRQTEGQQLKLDLQLRSKLILDSVAFVEQRSPETVKEYNMKLQARLKELLADANIEEQRLLSEAAIYADKVAVAEETVRLRSHLEQLATFLESDVAIGRKMDFLIQEINREANTIGSKSNDVEIARKVIDIKAEIEKIREQVQNIE